ncbi:MAG TPA: NUDIX domain-containing protein [Rhodospirillaceae bacterium]|nr:NUDIX domain-containing protein [Rhodospirillaceae bacterium]
MKIDEAIAVLDRAAPRPTVGLPDDVFYYISRTTPLVNVDLLIKDENGRTLLAWRNDRYCDVGWHVPGGIIRFKETYETRVEKVALSEIGVPVAFDRAPLAVTNMIHTDRDVRGHFISLLINCRLSSAFVPDNRTRSASDGGFLQWHDCCPDNLIPFHHVYRPFF